MSIVLRPSDYIIITIASIMFLFTIYYLWNRKRFPTLARVFLMLIKELGKDMADGKIDPEEAERLFSLGMNFIKTIIVQPNYTEEEKEEQEEGTIGKSSPLEPNIE